MPGLHDAGFYVSLGNPPRWEPPAHEIRYLGARLLRRDVLLGDELREANRLEKYLSTDTPAEIISSCMHMAQQLREEISNIERQIKAHIKASPALRRDNTLLTSIKSVGPQLGMHMLVVLRSHDFASAEQAAAFLGVVPFEKRSGTSVRSRPGCRKSIHLS